MTRVCHITSAHQPEDDRIFIKECVSLAQAGFEVFLVQKGESYKKGGVTIVGFGSQSDKRMKRMLLDSKKAVDLALQLDCDIYHLHDPELLSHSKALKSQGKKVIFDSHEDVPMQIMDKPWIAPPMRKAVSDTYKGYETSVVSGIDAVVAATPHIADQFEGRAPRVIAVNNFPRLDEIEFQRKPFAERDAIVCYVGVITENRGEGVMVASMDGVEGRLLLAGSHDESASVIEGEHDNVTYLGQIDRAAVNHLFSLSRCGLVVLQPTRAYLDSLPIKMFEYMAAGLPFVASDFPYWRELLQKHRCGLFVDPGNIYEVREAVRWFLSHPEAAQEMGLRGRKAVLAEFNWKNEERKLVELYKELES